MKGTVKIINSSGHDLLEYDTETVPESAEVAEERIKREMENGAQLFVLDKKNRGEHVKSFNPEEHEDYLVVPPIAGGS